MNDFQFISVPGKDALAKLDRLRAESSKSGLYPILLGDAQEKQDAFRLMEKGPDPAETLEYSRKIDVTAWLNEQGLEPGLYEGQEDDWPDKGEKMEIVTHLEVLTRKPKKQVFIALLKLNASWEAFAYLKWGAWNDCPEPAVHCAIHRYWASQYGAEVVSITNDIVQCIVARRPTAPPACDWPASSAFTATTSSRRERIP